MKCLKRIVLYGFLAILFVAGFSHAVLARISNPTSGSAIANIAGTAFIGIGTTTPGSLLSVAGSAGGTTPLFMLSTSTAGFATSTAFVIDANGNALVTGGANFTVTATGLVSKGSGGGVTIQSNPDSSQPGLFIKGFVSSQANIFTSSGSLRTLVINNNSSGGLKTTFSGGTGENQIGVGTSTPYGIFTVRASLSTSIVPIFEVASSTDASQVVVDYTGFLGLGTTSPKFGLSLDVVSGTAGTSTFSNGSGTHPGCYQTYSPNGTAYRVFVNNAGALTTVAGSCN